MFDSLDVPVFDRADIVVAGGGPAGIAASLAATRLGKSVILLEQTGSRFTVTAVVLRERAGEVSVSEVTLQSLLGRDPQELSGILNRQLGLSATVSEVNGQ